jgi:hypothetical protein
MTQCTETGELAEAFIADALAGHGIDRDQLTLHADRGTSMTSKPVAQLLVDLGVARSHSRPHVSNDNPYSEAQFKTLKYCPAFPGRFGSIEDARAFCATFFDYYNHEHRHAGVGLHTPASVHYGTAREIRAQRAATLDAAYAANPGQVSASAADTTEAAHRRLDQRTQPRSTHQIRMRSCLTGLDRFRPVRRNVGASRRASGAHLCSCARFWRQHSQLACSEPPNRTPRSTLHSNARAVYETWVTYATMESSPSARATAIRW